MAECLRGDHKQRSQYARRRRARARRAIAGAGRELQGCSRLRPGQGFCRRPHHLRRSRAALARRRDRRCGGGGGHEREIRRPVCGLGSRAGGQGRNVMKTVRLTAAQAAIRYIGAQLNEDGVPFIAGVWAIFGHGNVAGIGEALYAARETVPTWRGHNEQGMAHAAISYAKQLGRRRAMAVTSSIGPGATNMVTAAALAHVNRLPVLFLPGDVFAGRGPDPVLQQIEDFGDGTVSANDCFRPVSRYFDRISRPEHLLTALPRAFRVMTDPADCGPVTLAFCQDVQAAAYDWPESFFDKHVWRMRRVQPDPVEVEEVAKIIAAAKSPVIVAGG